MNGVSLFSSAGIAETYFKENGINILVASELIKKRCDLHSWLYKDCHTICGDIADPEVFEEIKKKAIENDCKFLIATPPCQGMSTLGKKEYEQNCPYSFCCRAGAPAEETNIFPQYRRGGFHIRPFLFGSI